MRCRSCNASMPHSPLFIKLEDGTIIDNLLCSTCTNIAEHPDMLDAAIVASEEDSKLIWQITHQRFQG